MDCLWDFLSWASLMCSSAYHVMRKIFFSNNVGENLKHLDQIFGGKPRKRWGNASYNVYTVYIALSVIHYFYHFSCLTALTMAAMSIYEYCYMVEHQGIWLYDFLGLKWAFLG